MSNKSFDEDIDNLLWNLANTGNTASVEWRGEHIDEIKSHIKAFGQQRADEVVRAVREAYDRMGRGNLLPGELEEAARSAARPKGKKEQFDPAKVSKCGYCHCMTHTVEGLCGKCKKSKCVSPKAKKFPCGCCGTGKFDAKLFILNRKEDETGVSGTGMVAIGVIFPSGQCVMSWLTKLSSVAVYPDIETLKKIHGHGGKTEVIQVLEFNKKAVEHRRMNFCQDLCENISMVGDGPDKTAAYLWNERETIIDWFEPKSL